MRIINRWAAVMAAILILGTLALKAGTIVFKDGTRISDVELVGISDGRITIEKDKVKRSFPLGAIESYSPTDLPSGESGGLPGDFADYQVRILRVDMPKTGINKDGKSTACKVGYSVSRKGSGKVKFPYFHLYVIGSRTSETERRPIYRFHYPDEAKPKGKQRYDQAAVLARLAAFDRPVLGDGQNFNLASGGLSGREVEFELKGVKGRKVLAYRLEVWGNDGLIATKEGKVDPLDARDVAERWWERY